MEGIVWQPTAEQVAAARITAFLGRAGVTSLEELQERAAADPGWFWGLVEQDLGIHWYEPYTQALDASRGDMWPRWFTGGRMNVAADCADKHVGTDRAGKAAVVWEGEEGAVRRWTYAELTAEANRLANALRRLGVGRGDRVGLFLPMVPETVAAIIAVAKVGAIFTPIFSGYAAPAVATRLADAGAKLLITADGFFRRGRLVDMKAAADEALTQAPSVEHVLVVQRTGAPGVPMAAGRDLWYHEAVGAESADFATEHMSAEDPLMIIYTSGTTGKPKGALHVHCGFPMKAAQDVAHLFDVGERDTLCWLSDIGWMMGPWMIFGTLMLGATCLLYDGAPDYPGPDRVWGLIERHRLTHLGIAPTLVRALMPHGDGPAQQHDLSSLRMFGSTGEPWNPDPYLWLYERVGGSRVPIMNLSGGTEISGGILGCVPTRPLKVASFNCVVPGMAADVVDESGRSVRGAVGELVIRRPWVGMTRGFWQDPKRYEETYWSRIPGLWVHGDWATVDSDGFWYIHGRSDDTLKVAGKRVGPAEVESALVAHEAVVEAAAIGVPHEVKGETVIGFVVLGAGVQPSEELRRALCDRVAAELGKALRPETVKFVRGLPKTRNAKIMRRVIRAVWLGQAPGDLTALENPEMVEEIRAAR